MCSCPCHYPFCLEMCMQNSPPSPIMWRTTWEMTGMGRNLASLQNPLPGTTICHHLGGSHNHVSPFFSRNRAQRDTVLSFLSPQLGEELSEAPVPSGPIWPQIHPFPSRCCPWFPGSHISRLTAEFGQWEALMRDWKAGGRAKPWYFFLFLSPVGSISAVALCPMWCQIPWHRPSFCPGLSDTCPTLVPCLWVCSGFL